MRRRAIVLLAPAVSLLLTGCGSYQWGWYVVSPFGERGRANIAFLADGFVHTVLLSIVAMAISILLGGVFALLALSGKPAAQAASRIYVEGVRAVPLLVLLLWVYYGLPIVLDIRLGPFAAGVIALSLSDSAFEAEIFRAGIQSIGRGQIEAADALGLAYLAKLRFVILPQAIRRILPPLGNQLVYMLKMSSLVSVIGMSDLTRQANELVVTEYRPLEIYSFLVLEYLVLILLVSAAMRRLERRLRADERLQA